MASADRARFRHAPGAHFGHLAYRRRWARAVGVVLAVRLLLAGAAAVALTVVLGSWMVGPMSGFVASTLAWATILAGTTALLAWAVWPFATAPAPRDFSILRQAAPALSSTLRSAIEFGGTDEAPSELVAAHARDAQQRLSEKPVRGLLPWHWVLDKQLLSLVALAMLLLVVASNVPRVAGGSFALFSAGRGVSPGQTQVGYVVERTQATFVFPEYMKRLPSLVAPAEELRAFRGASVEYRIRTVGRAESVTVQTPGQRVSAESVDDREHVARFVLEADGPIEIFVADRAGRRRVDRATRSISVIEDDPPKVVLVQPSGNMAAGPNDSIDVLAIATDNHGVAETHLMVEGPGGVVWRRPMPHEAVRRTEVGLSLMLSELDLEPGDSAQLWVEASDANSLDGPGVGRSEVRVVTLASKSTKRRVQIAGLEQALDEGIVALADRLELPVDGTSPGPRDRHATVAAASGQFVASLASWHEQSGAPAAERTVLGNSAHRLRKLLARESGYFKKRHMRVVEKRTAVDAEVVGELEDAVLVISDLLSAARLTDAASGAKELERLRREMRSLLEEIRRTNSPQAERALRASLARAERRMQELLQQLVQSKRFVPGEFVNQEASNARSSQSSLRDLRQAINKGDLDAAERALMGMERTIDDMAKALSSSQEAFAEARFGKRERALSGALDGLRALEVRQDQLAEQSIDVSREVSKRAGEQALGQLDDETRDGLSRQTQDASAALRRMPAGALGPEDRRARDTAMERLNDVALALERGQIGEAFSMADEAARTIDDLAREMRLSALMFPGRGGRTSRAAAEAAAAAQDANQLRDGLQSALPDAADQIEPADKRALRAQAARQRRARRQLEKLAERFQNGPDDVPLSEDVANKLEELRGPMTEAAEHLDAGDPLRAGPRQRAAADHLRQLRESLEQGQSGSGGGSQSDGAGRGSRNTNAEKVNVPGRRADESRRAWRRKVQGARRGRTPKGAEAAVREYYERLLR